MHERRSLPVWLYELTMATLAILTVWLLALPHSPETELANRVIWGIFVLDEVVRLGRAPDRKRFVREHLIELIAILPWDWFRAARVLRLVRLLHAGVWIWRATRELRAIARQNGLAPVPALSDMVALGVRPSGPSSQPYTVTARHPGGRSSPSRRPVLRTSLLKRQQGVSLQQC